MRFLLAIAAACVRDGGPPPPSADPDPFHSCQPATQVEGLPCERGYDCQVVCDCGVEPVGGGNCADTRCESIEAACDFACLQVDGSFSGRTCAPADTGLWPPDFF